MKILLAPIEISGFYRSLNSGFRALGVDSTFAELWPHPYGYASGDPPPPRPVHWAQIMARRQRATRRRSIRWLFWAGIGAVLRLVVFTWAAARFDVFIFAFGRTILEVPALELRLLRLLRRRIVFHFHGSDSRPPYFDGYLGTAGTAVDGPSLARLSARTKRRIDLIDRLADIVVDSPLSGHFHVRDCVNAFIVGLPSLDGNETPPGKTNRALPVRILHAPSHLRAKGTLVIREAIARLAARGLKLEYVELVGQPNEKVLEELRACDMVIDQLYSDTPMAGFAAEAARMGRPAIVGGYAGAEFNRWIPAEALAPTQYVHPDELEPTIERLAVDAALREELGRRAHDFVVQRCDATAVAARYLAVLTDSAPRAWYFDPRTISYIHGCGLSEVELRSRLRDLLSRGGSDPLRLDGNPDLIDTIQQFVADTGSSGDDEPR